MAATPVVSESPANSEVPNEPTKDEQSPVVLAPLPEYFDEPGPLPKSVTVFSVFLGLSIFVFLFQLKVLIGFMGSHSYQLATDQGLSLGFYNPLAEPMIYAELLLKFVQLVAALAVMVLLLKKSWAFLRWGRIYLFATALFQLAEIVGVLILRASFVKNMEIKPTQLEELQLTTGLITAAAFILISLGWAAYFEKSERVRKVFIN